MSELNQFFDNEIKAIATNSKAIAKEAAEGLQDEIYRQIRQNFNNPSAAFSRGITIHEFEEAVYVRLSPILSSHAQAQTISGNPNLWILLSDGIRLGFKRMGTGGFNWTTLKNRYGKNLAFVPINNGFVVLFNGRGRPVPIYKIQNQIQTKQRIKFFESAEKIAEEYNLEIID